MHSHDRPGAETRIPLHAAAQLDERPQRARLRPRPLASLLPVQPRGRRLGQHELGSRDQRRPAALDRASRGAAVSRRRADLLGLDRRAPPATRRDAADRVLHERLRRRSPGAVDGDQPRRRLHLGARRPEPGLDRGTSAFRDPKVIRFTDGDGGTRWIMLAVEADDRQVLFYSSRDLRSWEYLSSFGPVGDAGVVWECPDLVPLAVDGDPNHLRWVLLLSTNPVGDDANPDGSSMSYIVGHFDGVSVHGGCRGADAPRPRAGLLRRRHLRQRARRRGGHARLDEQLALRRRLPFGAVARCDVTAAADVAAHRRGYAPPRAAAAGLRTRAARRCGIRDRLRCPRSPSTSR